MGEAIASFEQWLGVPTLVYGTLAVVGFTIWECHSLGLWGPKKLLNRLKLRHKTTVVAGNVREVLTYGD